MGVTIARVLCQQFNTKLIGVPSLKILSYLNNENTHTTVVLDARKNKVYFGEYENGVELTQPCLKDKDELISAIKPNSVIISDSSIGEFLNQNGLSYIKYEEREDNLGLYLSSIVLNSLKNFGEDLNWAKVKPLYIQKPSISKPKEKTNV